MWRLALVLALAQAGCGGLEPRRGHGHGPGPGVGCRAGDADCAEVEAHLDTIRAEWGHWCATVKMQELGALVRMGDRAVPTLRRELDAESRVHAAVSSYVLHRLGRGDDVVAWCLGRRGAGNRDVICGGAPPGASAP